jgi:hypothetical protein
MPLDGFDGFEEDHEPPPGHPGLNGRGKHESGPNGYASGSADEPWQEPLDLFAEHLAITAEIDGTCLPATILNFARAEAIRLSVDPVGIAAAAVAVCSGVISDDWEVRLKQHDPWSQQPRLWVGIVERPGSKKTEQLRSARRPLDRIEGERRRAYQAAFAEYREAHTAWKKLPKKERDAQNEPQPPVEPRITTQDTTIEAYSELLQNASKIVAMLDELAGFLGSLDRYTNGRCGAGRSHAIELYEGGPRRIDRVMRGSIYLANWSAVVVGAIQPEKLRGMIKDLSTDGLLQRFMIIVPSQVQPSDPDDDDKPGDKPSLDAYEALIRGLSTLRPPPRAGNVQLQDGHLQVWAGAAAQPHRRRLFRLVERLEADPNLPTVVRETAPKWRGQLARLALVFHCIGLTEGTITDAATLTPSSVEMAANFIRRIVAPSTFRFYRELGLDGDPHARWVACHILAHRLQQVSARDIGRVYHELRGDIPGIVRTMGLLEHAGWARGGQHPKTPKWEINPAVHARFVGRAAAERARRDRIQELIGTSIDELCR